MSKSILISHADWNQLKATLEFEGYPKSVFLIREKMKKILGFTPREHFALNTDLHSLSLMYLDFFDEQKKIFFLLKYGDLIKPLTYNFTYC